MLKQYSNYIKENTDNTYTVICYVDDNQVLEISGQKTISDAFNNEFGWLEQNGIKLNSFDKIDNDHYKFNISTSRSPEEIKREFGWLEQSAIIFKSME